MKSYFILLCIFVSTNSLAQSLCGELGCNFPVFEVCIYTARGWQKCLDPLAPGCGPCPGGFQTGGTTGTTTGGTTGTTTGGTTGTTTGGTTGTTTGGTTGAKCDTVDLWGNVSQSCKGGGSTGTTTGGASTVTCSGDCKLTDDGYGCEIYSSGGTCTIQSDGICRTVKNNGRDNVFAPAKPGTGDLYTMVTHLPDTMSAKEGGAGCGLIPGANCSAVVSQSWTVGGSTCSAGLASTADGNTQSISDSSSPSKGSASYKCVAGAWQLLSSPAPSCTTTCTGAEVAECNCIRKSSIFQVDDLTYVDITYQSCMAKNRSIPATGTYISCTWAGPTACNTTPSYATWVGYSGKSPPGATPPSCAPGYTDMGTSIATNPSTPGCKYVCDYNHSRQCYKASATTYQSGTCQARGADYEATAYPSSTGTLCSPPACNAGDITLGQSCKVTALEVGCAHCATWTCWNDCQVP